MKELYDDCDEDCMKEGTNWSAIILANGIMMILLFCNLGCVIMGRIKAFWRVLAAYTGFIIFLANLAILATTGYYRYRTQGSLCALYTEMSHAPTTEPLDVNDDWTFEKDGSLILALWLIQAIFMIPCCLLATW